MAQKPLPYLEHYGIKRKSGRYPWGSGEEPYQHESWFLGRVGELRAQGLTDREIAKEMGMSVAAFNKRRTVENEAKKAADTAMAIKLKDKGYSNVAIAERLGVTEGTVRNMLKPTTDARANTAHSIAESLKQCVADGKYIDVGAGVEIRMGVSREKLKAAIALLKEEGYQIHYSSVEQAGTGKQTSLMVLTDGETTGSEVWHNRHNIQIPNVHIEEGQAFVAEPPRSIDSKRVLIKYAEEGGLEKDGVMEIRRGVDELSLGNAKYAQVRIAVDGTHYLKGMAYHQDNIPDGYDIVFYTNKSKNVAKLDVLKKLETKSEDNPFGATIKLDHELLLTQRHYTDKDGNLQLSAINIVNEEGNWRSWAKTLSSQMLSKQTHELASKQLGIAYDKKQAEHDEIMRVTNPTLKRMLLDSFADNCESAAVHLRGAPIPGQGAHVILPFPDMKENEIYAPNYKTGDKVVLIRYPHGGRFEIPELTVNNRQPTAKSVIGNGVDAVGINHKVAERLSGADFDGDTVMVIPNNNGAIKTAKALDGLKNFDPHTQYAGYPGMQVLSKKNTGLEMGKISNLITDMTIKGANSSELARAVRHSMVVIDANKHKLNYKQSFIDNDIASLKEKYQGSAKAGASTLISKASADQYVAKRKEGALVEDPVTGKKRRIYTDPETGDKLYTETGEVSVFTKTNKKGEVKVVEKPKQTKSTRMAEAKDAHTLSSGTKMEEVYANHANALKNLARQSRLEALNTPDIEYSPSAYKTYSAEVASLKTKLKIAKSNAPLERKAQAIAEKEVRQLKADNPQWEAADVKKAKGNAIKKARVTVGAKKDTIVISDKEWAAIQSGAVHKTTLIDIFNNADQDHLKTLATPRASTTMSSSKIARARAMLNNGATQAEVADALGVSVSTILNNLY